MKQQPDQATINSVFEAIQASDQNASVTLSVLAEEMDFNNAIRVISIADENSKLDARDPLNIYLHTVYNNGAQTLNILLDQGADNNAVSVVTSESNIAVLQKSKSLKTPLLIENGNDVCWAILSDHDEALSNLEQAYTQRNMDMNVNQREAIPHNVANLRNADARKHTPLDLAIMQYVAQKRSEAKEKDNFTKKSKAMASAIGSMLEPILKEFGEAGRGLGGIGVMPQNIKTPEIHSVATLSNIKILLDNGAQGSVSSYFPASDESLDRPFISDDSFEVMSLDQFCTENSGLFPSTLYDTLTNRTSISNDLENG